MFAIGRDDCSTADLIAGSGSFFFDNSLATTGLEGQSESICYVFSTTAVIHDVWFDWKADFTGLVQIDTCGSPTDTKIAAYPGAGCPTTGTALGCNDDLCGWQSLLQVDVIDGQMYAIQVGLYPLASGGTGNLNIDEVLPAPCGMWHDQIGNDALGVSHTDDGSIGWIVYEDCLSWVGSMEAAFGFVAGIDGAPLWIVVYDDPTNDMDPRDAVLLHSISIPGGTMNSNTGIMNEFDFNTLLGAPVAGTGGMWFGCVVDICPAGTFPAPWDSSRPDPGANWFFANELPNVMDQTNITNNQVFGDTSTWGDPDFLITVNGMEIGAEPGVQYCPGDGIFPHTLCPCANNNNGSMGGCDWGDLGFPEGGVLSAIGSDSMAANDTVLIATGVANDFGIFFGANNQVNGGNGNPLNDGLRCAGGGLERLIPPTIASGNQAMTLQPIQTLDSGAAVGGTRRYQYWFRTPGGVCGQMANLTNGYEVVWLP